MKKKSTYAATYEMIRIFSSQFLKPFLHKSFTDRCIYHNFHICYYFLLNNVDCFKAVETCSLFSRIENYFAIEFVSRTGTKVFIVLRFGHYPFYLFFIFLVKPNSIKSATKVLKRMKKLLKKDLFALSVKAKQLNHSILANIFSMD